jgi:hypothetical protein
MAPMKHISLLGSERIPDVIVHTMSSSGKGEFFQIRLFQKEK